MPVFVSYNPADYSLAEAVKAGIAKFEPKTTFAFSPIKPGQGYWLPKFGEAIREADAFVLTVGPAGITPQQEREAYEAFDRRAQDSRFPFVVPIAGGYAPGLPFLGDLTWIEASEIANDAVRQRILAALKGEPGAMVSPRWKLVRPYRGRQPMTTSDTGWFHGRTAETDAVLTALHRHNERLPVLIGEAGVGKSSVAQAGVLAALTAMRRPGGSGSWPDGFRNSRGGWALLTVRPGDAPLEALAAAFIQLCYANPNDAECQALTRTWTDNLKGAKTLSDLMETTRQRLNDSDRTRPARVLLYLDGLDELYTRAARTSPKEARAFSQVLADGLGDPDLFAVASFRSEEIEALDADDGLSQIYDAIEMPRLTEAQLLEVATGPAKSLGVAFEDAQAPQRLVGGFAKESDALPRLSEGLAGLWSEMTARGDGVLRLPTSGDPGGVGVQPDPPPSNDREFVAFKTTAERAEQRWRASGRSNKALLTGDDLAQAELWLARRPRGFRPQVREFLQRSIAVNAGEQEPDNGRSWWKVAGAAAAVLAMTAAGAFAWQQWGGTILANIGIAGIWSGPGTKPDDAAKKAVADAEKAAAAKKLADAQKAAATTKVEPKGGKAKSAEESPEQLRVRAALAQKQLEAGNAETALLIALEALPDPTAGVSRPLIPEARLQLEAAWKRVWKPVIVRAGKKLWGAGFSPDGKLIVAASDDTTAQVWDTETGSARGNPLKGHTGRVRSAVFSPDGARILTASNDGMARLWAVADGKVLGELRHDKPILSASFAPDGKRIVTASADFTAKVWDAENKPLGEALKGHTNAVLNARFRGDGLYIVTASTDATARVWDAKTNLEDGEALTGHKGAVQSAVFNSDGTLILTASIDTTARIWDAKSRKSLNGPLQHSKQVRSAVFSPNGKRILTASDDKTAHLWDAAGKPLGEPLAGHGAAVLSAEFSLDGKYIVTASEDATARIWPVVLETEELIEHAKRAVRRCLTPEQRAEFSLPSEPPQWCAQKR